MQQQILIGLFLFPYLSFSQSSQKPHSSVTDPSNKNTSAQIARSAMKASVTGDSFFSSPPEGSKAILYSQAVKSDADCLEKCQIIAQLPAGVELFPTGEHKSFESKSGSGLPQLYNLLEVIYTQNDEPPKKAWVSAEMLSKKDPLKLRADYVANLREKNNLLKADSSNPSPFSQFCAKLRKTFFPETPLIEGVAEVHSIVLQTSIDSLKFPQSVTSAASKLEKYVGQCVIDPPNKISEKDLKGPISYDSLVLPKMGNALSKVPELNIPGLSSQKLLEIDLTARTIFAEVGKCVPYGAEYAMAVARVIKNREKFIEENPKSTTEFIWQKESLHWPGKSIATKVGSSPVQFSAWNNYIIDFPALIQAKQTKAQEYILKGSSAKEAQEKADAEVRANSKTLDLYKFNASGMLHSLCPPSDRNKDYYDGHKPSASLNAIWQSILKVATESVLFPKQFLAKTEGVKKVLHYTSNRKSFFDFYQVHPKIEGRIIDREDCLNLWVDPKKYPKTAEPKSSAKSRK